VYAKRTTVDDDRSVSTAEAAIDQVEARDESAN